MEDGSKKAMNVFSLVYALVSFRIENFSLNGMGGFDSFSLQIALDNLVWVLYLRCLKLVLCPECLDLKLFWVRPKYFFFILTRALVTG